MSNLPSNCLYDLPHLPPTCPPEIAKSDLPSNHQVRFTHKSSVRFTPPEIAKSDLPSNRQVRFTLKSSVRFTPPRNRQVRFTFKSPSPIYPQIICTIYPPKSPSPIYLQIAKSDLPSNRLYDLPPRNRQVRFTLKSPTAIYPWQFGGVNRQRRFEGKSYR